VNHIKVPGYFPDREYCFAVLGNGVDLLYVDWSGAMSFKDQINGNFSYWYKLDRKPCQKSDPLPLLRVKYCLISHAGPVEIDDSKQFFDPQRGVLTSVISAQPFSFTVLSFLTNNHLFVLEFTFHRFFENCSICFALDDNRITYTRKLIDTLSEPVRYTVEDGLIKAFYRNKSEICFQGIGLMDVIVPSGATAQFFDKNTDSNTPVFPYLSSNVFVEVKNLKPQDKLYCLACVMDNMDSENYHNDVFQPIKDFRQKTFKKIYTTSTSEWKQFCGASSVHISKDIDYMFQLSKYLLKAVQFPTGAIIPSALFPNNHGCLVYWDAFFDQMGLMRTNHIEQARKIAYFWYSGLEKARENTKKLKGQGAYYGWAVDFHGYDPSALDVNQIHFNGDIALSCWKYYEYSLDSDYLRKIFPVIKEAIDFLISVWVEQYSDGIRVKYCESLDESSYERISDTWTTSLIIKGIENIIKAADILGQPVEISEYETVRKGLLQALKRNVKNGILYSHGEGGDLNIGSILALTILDEIEGVDKIKTFKKYASDVKEKSGLGWGHSSRMRCRIFPWAELMTAIFLARERKTLAFQFVENAIKATNSFGGFAEYIWLHGLISRNWYVSAHGTFLWAISEMLAAEDQNNIHLFPGFSDDMITDNIRFENIRLKGCLRISASVKKDRLALLLYNDGKSNVRKNLCFRNKNIPVEVAPDKKTLLKIDI